MKTIIVLLHATILLWALACLEGCASDTKGPFDLGGMFNAKDFYARADRAKSFNE
jgi:hypothetical protein